MDEGETSPNRYFVHRDCKISLSPEPWQPGAADLKTQVTTVRARFQTMLGYSSWEHVDRCHGSILRATKRLFQLLDPLMGVPDPGFVQARTVCHLAHRF
eukprot:SAG31_NODE_8893_length_1367_cov_1.455836_1_plen_99_part_00